MTPPEHPETKDGHYIYANGMDIYYEEQGQGKALLLLHAGTLSAESWQPYLAAFAEHFRVVTPDSRGHGRSTNPIGTMSYRLFADDVAALAQALDLQKPLICGYSDGGQVALEIGMRYPDLAQALVVGGAWFKFSKAYREWVRAILGDEQSPDVDTERFEREFPGWAAGLQKTHGADNWKRLLKQLKPMWVAPLNYTPDDFAQVVAPTLVLLGDHDQFIPVEEAGEMYRLLPNAELAVVPGADHGAFFSAKVAIYQSLMLDFMFRHSDAVGQVAPSESTS